VYLAGTAALTRPKSRTIESGSIQVPVSYIENPGITFRPSEFFADFRPRVFNEPSASALTTPCAARAARFSLIATSKSCQTLSLPSVTTLGETLCTECRGGRRLARVVAERTVSSLAVIPWSEDDGNSCGRTRLRWKPLLRPRFISA
jgi:hypothetical protein